MSTAIPVAMAFSASQETPDGEVEEAVLKHWRPHRCILAGEDFTGENQWVPTVISALDGMRILIAEIHDDPWNQKSLAVLSRSC